MRGAIARLLLLLLAAAPPAAALEETVPPYRLPEVFDGAPAVAPEPVARLVATVVGERDRDCQEAWRVLAGLGRPAVPAVVRALGDAPWFGRSLLMAALAESGVPEVAPVLVEGTRDPSWAVREMAAHGLGLAPCPEGATALLALLEDPSWRVRRSAAAALRQLVARGGCERSVAIDALLPLTASKDRDVRLGALTELGLLRADEAREAFLAGYREDDEEIRRASFTALVNLDADPEALIPAMEEALDRSEEEVFLQAAEKLAEIDGARLLADADHLHRLLRILHTDSVGAGRVFTKLGRAAVPVLLEELRDTFRPRRIRRTPDISRTILDLVEKLLGAETAPVLEQILTKWRDCDPARRYAAVLARRYHAAALADTLAALYPKEGFADIRSSLLRGIDAANHKDLAKYLRDAILSGNPELQDTAYGILVRRDDVDVEDALVLALETEERDHRIAKKWLARLIATGSPQAPIQAARLLAHPDPAFREVGADGLSRFPDREDTLPLLVAAYDREDGRDRRGDEVETPERLDMDRRKVVRAILRSAALVGGAAALPLLERAAASADPVVREHAIRESRSIRDERALALAVAALEDETEPGVLREARRAIVSWDTPEARALVAKRLTGEDPAERRGFLRALRVVGEATVPPVLVDALAKGRWEPEARRLAVEVLDGRRAPEHLALLVRLAREDPDHELRCQAVRVLGESGQREAIPPLLSLLPDAERSFDALGAEAKQLAFMALQALGDLGAEEAGPRIRELLRRAWPRALVDHTRDRHHLEAVRLLVSALGRIRDPGAIPLLVELLLSPELFRRFSLLEAAPARDERRGNVLGVLVGALVRFPDEELARAGRAAIGKLRESGDAYRIDEGYLLHVAGLLADPRREGIGRPQPRRALAAELHRLVLDVVPRDGGGDLVSLSYLVSRSADAGRFAEAAALEERSRALTELVDPLGYARKEALRRAEVELLRGMALRKAGKEEEGRALYRSARDRDPEDPDLLNLYAWWLAETGLDLEEALGAALEAGRRAASDPNVVDTLGWVLFRLGRCREAELKLYEAVRLDREQAERDPARRPDPLLVYHLATASAGAGHETYAARKLAEAVSMDDTLADAARDSPSFAPLREAGLLEEAISVGLGSIPR